MSADAGRDDGLPYRDIFDLLPVPLIVYDVDGTIVAVNDANCARFGITRERIVGRYNLLEDPQAEEKGFADGFRRARAGEFVRLPPLPYDTTHESYPSGEPRRRWSQATFTPVRDGDTVRLVATVSLDVTAQKQAEDLQAEALLAQEEMLRALSTPLLPIARGVVVVPLIGEMTRQRGEQLIERLLEGIATQQARIAILDVTGLSQAREETTDALIRAARCARLLGAEVVLTGIAPTVARALVELGADLGGIVTLGTLEQGVTHALAGCRAARAARV